MTFYTFDHTYDYDFDTVSTAFWRKYPNKYSEHIKEIDVFHRTFDPKTGDLTTHRLIACESALPTWVLGLGVSPFMFAAEQSVVNARKKEMTVRARNITGSSVVQVEEECTYKVNSKDRSKTDYQQKAKVTAFVPIFYRKLENYSVANFASKSKQGLEVMEHFCENLRKYGLGYCFSLLGLSSQ